MICPASSNTGPFSTIARQNTDQWYHSGSVPNDLLGDLPWLLEAQSNADR